MKTASEKAKLPPIRKGQRFDGKKYNPANETGVVKPTDTNTGQRAKKSSKKRIGKKKFKKIKPGANGQVQG